METKVYHTISGDRWDMIAHKTMGSAERKDLLMKANLKYLDIVVFSAGIELLIPELEPEQNQQLPPWKRGENIL